MDCELDDRRRYRSFKPGASGFKRKHSLRANPHGAGLAFGVSVVACERLSGRWTNDSLRLKRSSAHLGDCALSGNALENAQKRKRAARETFGF
jgi:hypothetical protein